jgi:hypothetical protein
MDFTGVFLPKFGCVPATKRSATRLPTSWGEQSFGHDLKSRFTVRVDVAGAQPHIPATTLNAAAIMRCLFIVFIAILSPYLFPKTV